MDTDLDILNRLPPPDVIYPSIRPISEYDLLTDPIHQYGKQGVEINDDPAVLVSDLNIRFQLAREAPTHLWPHNATPLGFVRYIPTKEDLGTRLPRPKGGSCLKFYHHKLAYESVLFSFMYTHPELNCESCMNDNLDCVHVEWDWPDFAPMGILPESKDPGLAADLHSFTPTNDTSARSFFWPGKHSDSLIALRCYCCRVNGRQDCSIVGRHILAPDSEILEGADQVDSKMRDERAKFRNGLGTMRTYYTIKRNDFVIEAVDPVAELDGGTGKISTSNRNYGTIELDRPPDSTEYVQSSRVKKRPLRLGEGEDGEQQAKSNPKPPSRTKRSNTAITSAISTHPPSARKPLPARAESSLAKRQRTVRSCSKGETRGLSSKIVVDRDSPGVALLEPLDGLDDDDDDDDDGDTLPSHVDSSDFPPITAFDIPYPDESTHRNTCTLPPLHNPAPPSPLISTTSASPAPPTQLPESHSSSLPLAITTDPSTYLREYQTLLSTTQTASLTLINRMTNHLNSLQTTIKDQSSSLQLWKDKHDILLCTLQAKATEYGKMNARLEVLTSRNGELDRYKAEVEKLVVRQGLCDTVMNKQTKEIARLREGKKELEVELRKVPELRKELQCRDEEIKGLKLEIERLRAPDRDVKAEWEREFREKLDEGVRRVEEAMANATREHERKLLENDALNTQLTLKLKQLMATGPSSLTLTPSPRLSPESLDVGPSPPPHRTPSATNLNADLARLIQSVRSERADQAQVE